MTIKLVGESRLSIPTLVMVLLLFISTTTSAQTNWQTTTPSSDRLHREEESETTTETITQVHRLRDLSPSDWAYEALRSLSDRYGCITGFDDYEVSIELCDINTKLSGINRRHRTYRGEQTISRYEFAAGLNSCLNEVEQLLNETEYSAFDRQDLEILQRLTQEFATELAMIRGRVSNLENRTTQLEDNQFSTTTKLTGEVVFGLASVLAGSKDNGESNIDRVAVFGNTVDLELETSFTGEDELAIELEAANFPDFADETGTFQGELSFGGSNDNNLELDVLAYSFPLGDNLEIIIGATGLAADDIAETINFFESDDGGSGAISNFGSLNPIYETAEDAGLGIIYELGEIIELSVGYLASAANEPSDEGGIFNAPYGAIAQAIVSPSDRLDLAVTYIHSRDLSDTDTGSNLANLQSFTEDEFGAAVPTVSDSYGVEFSYELSDFLVLGGWGGLSKVTTLSSLSGAIDRGTQDVWNWAITLAFPDLGKEGNLGGIIIGAEPWVTNSSINSLGEDEDFSWHLEAFYQYQVTDNIAVTPGIVWITAPDNNNQNNDLVIGAIRTTFTF